MTPDDQRRDASAHGDGNRRRRYRAPVRRQMLIQAARECILNKGLLGTSAREVAAVAGVSVGTVAYHFESVDDMLIEVLRAESETFHQELREEIATIGGFRERLQLIVNRPFGSSEELDASWRLWLEYWAREIHDAKLASVHSERRSAWHDIIEQTISDGIAEGACREVDVAEMVAEIIAITDGFLIQATFGDDPGRVTRARARLQAAIDVRLERPSDEPESHVLRCSRPSVR